MHMVKGRFFKPYCALRPTFGPQAQLPKGAKWFVKSTSGLWEGNMEGGHKVQLYAPETNNSLISQ